jgi:hypothetical protein
VIYQDPLAYLIGLEGIALLDAWAGDHDREFTDARLAEIRRLPDDESSGTSSCPRIDSACTPRSPVAPMVYRSPWTRVSIAIPVK